MKGRQGRVDRITLIVEKFCADFPELASRTLARKIIEEGKLTASLDSIRDRVRSRRGKKGVHSRQAMKIIPSTYQYIADETREPFEPYDMSGRLGRGLICADIHVPFHDKSAIMTMLNYTIREEHTDFVVILGDLIDWYALSFFSHDPKRDNIAKSREIAWQFFDTIKEIMGDKCKIILKFANHDFRWVRNQWNKEPEMMDLKELQLNEILKVKDWDIDIVGFESPILCRELNLMHGHEWGNGSSCPVNPARTAYLKTGECTLVAHSHKTSEHTDTTLRDKIITCWSIGCLCNLHPQWKPLANKWNHGFALLENEKNGFLVRNHRIYNGKVF